MDASKPDAGLNRAIPYTHWAYFRTQAEAARCADDLSTIGEFVTRVQEAIVDEVEPEGFDWLLLAAADVTSDALAARHTAVEEVVERCGGLYDGGGVAFDSDGPTADSMVTRPPL